MYTRVVIAVIIFSLQFKEGECATACSTPGMYLSTDSQYCFGYSALGRNWNYHAMICEAYNSKMINIDSAAKLTLVQSFLSEQTLPTDNKLYIGLTNIIGSGSDWIWYEGNITSYDRWANSEPVDTYRYNCAYMLTTTNEWYADGCLKSYPSVCEREATSEDITWP